MTQALSESFCERCGTRYQLESHRAKSGALAGVRVLGKGLRKLALTRASSLDEALETARHDDERAANSRALEEFHGTFHFCLSCRQYTCVTCWNPAAGVCLACAPATESDTAEDIEAPRTAMTSEQARPEQEAASRPAHDQIAIPRQVDEWGRPISGAVAAAPSAPEAVAAPNPAAAEAASIGPIEMAARPAEPLTKLATGRATDAPPAQFDDDAPIASHMAPRAKVEGRPIVVQPAVDEPMVAGPLVTAAAGPGVHVPASAADWLHPGTSLDAAIAAYEAALRSEAQLVITPVVAAAEPEPMVEPEPELEPEVAAAEPDPMVEPVPEPEVAAAEPEPMVEPEPELEPEVAAAEPEPMVATPPRHPSTADLLPFVTAPSPRPQPPVEPLRAAAHLQADADVRRSEASGFAEDPRFAAWSIHAPEAPRPVAGPTPAEAVRSAAKAVGVSTPASGPVATAPRVATTAGGQACVNCGLSLSTTARFCRRCGTSQG